MEGNLEPRGSFGSGGSSSSRRRRSFNSSGIAPNNQTDGDAESESVSEAGDIGDRAIHSGRSDSHRLSFDLASESSNSIVVVPVAKQADSEAPSAPLALVSESEDKDVPKLLAYSSCLIHLAVFGIFGVLNRFYLQKLFGPRIAGLTSNESVLYLDLPSNMVGSFLMGWFGVVFKADIACVSDFLAIGLTTGYLGSLTTFSGWNQKMLELSVEGQWVPAIAGFFIGLFLAAYSIILGVETGRALRVLLVKKIKNRRCKIDNACGMWRVDTFKLHMGVMMFFLLMLALLWILSGVLLREEFSSDTDDAELWLGCLVGPFGVWLRWFLARLNGRGLGKAGHLKWIPFGTLIANVAASGIMAALATVKKAVNTKSCDTILTGIQLGFLGCLSTVSTFIAEFNAMRESIHFWQAYAYAMITVSISLVLGILIYSVPVWTEGFE